MVKRVQHLFLNGDGGGDITHEELHYADSYMWWRYMRGKKTQEETGSRGAGDMPYMLPRCLLLANSRGRIE